MKKILFIAWGLLMAVTSFGQDSLITDSTQMIQGDTVSIHNAEFSGSKLEDATKAEGDSAYIRNDFASAIQIYESLLRKGESADVYYNLGNSYYKINEIAKAILNYEKALLLQPGNGDIRANLEIARGKTVDKVEVVPASLFEAPESAYAHITEVIIPKNVKEIGAFAFNNCKDLKKITIKGATIVPNSELYNPFNGCSKSLVFERDKGKNAENYAKKYHFKILYLKSGNKPQNLIGSITGKKIILRWDKVNAINGFEVYCKVGNGKYKKIADTSKNSYTYKKLSKKKTCYFKVRSYVMNNGAKEYSSFSDVVKARAW